VVALLVTASGATIAGIGAPFWGLVAGAAIARLVLSAPRTGSEIA
jgi:predicted benzoate:H+ symporter BenE